MSSQQVRGWWFIVIRGIAELLNTSDALSRLLQFDCTSVDVDGVGINPGAVFAIKFKPAFDSINAGTG